MSRIDDLLREHCPDGVESRSVAAATHVIAMPGKVKREDYQARASYPVVDQSLDFIAGYTDDPSVVVPVGEYVVFGDHTRAIKYIDFAFAQGADGVKVLRPTSGLTARWLYYCLSALDVPSRGYNRHWTVLRALQIPLPPLEVQREIVRILDHFTELEAELEAELEGRRVQYAYYRDSLLSFEGNAAPVRWVPIGELGEIFRGKRFTKNDYVDEGGIGVIHYGEIYTYYGTSATNALAQVRPELARQLRFAQPGDVVIAGVGETVEDVAKAVAWLGDTEVAIHDDCFAFRSEEDPTYIAYAMQTASYHAQKEQYVARAKVKRVGAANLGKIVLPVPPIEEQRRIVGILDKFDALVNDLSIGLPAELAARRRQYEYYRDRLLTFEEAME